MVGDNALDPAARQASESSDASFGRKPRASYTIYLACWMAALAAACSLALRICPSISPDAELILRVALKAPPILAMLATACYLWILFHTTRDVTWMFAALGLVAGLALTFGYMVTVVMVGESHDDRQLAIDVMLTLSRLGPAVLFAVAAFSTAIVPARRAKAVAARGMLTALLGTAFALVVIAQMKYITPQISSALASHGPAGTAALWETFWRRMLITFHLAGLFAAAAAFGLATVGYWRQAILSNNRVAALISYWLVAMSLATLAEALAAQEGGGHIWLASGTMANLGAAFLVVGGCIEAGLAHRLFYRRTTELEAMHTVTTALVGAKGSSQTWENVITAAARALHAHLAALFVAGEDNSLSLIAVHGFDDAQERIGKTFHLQSEARSGFHTGNTAQSFRERKMIILREALTECDFVPWRVAAKLQGCVVCAPVIYGDKCLGVLDFMLPVELSHLALRTRLVELIARVMAPALETYAESIRPQHEDELPRAA